MLSPKANILMLCPHDPDRDPRIHWEASSLAKKYNVIVCGFDDYLNDNDSLIYEDYRKIKIKSKRNVLKTLLYIILQYYYTVELVLFIIFLPVILALTPLFFAAVIFIKTFKSFKKKSNTLNYTDTDNKGIIYRIKLILNFIYSLSINTFNLLKVKKHLDQKPDIIHCHDLDSLIVGVILKSKYKSKLVYDAHEFYSDLEPCSSNVLSNYISALERKLVKSVDKIITVTPQIAKILEQSFEREVAVLPNAEIYHDNITPLNSINTNLKNNKVIFIYQGNFLMDRGLEELVRAWKQLDTSDALLCFRGKQNKYSEYINKLCEDQIKKGSVIFLEAVQENKLVAAAMEADIGIIPYKPINTNYKFCGPNKLSQYLHAGLAIFSNDLVYVKEIINEADCGFSYNSNTLTTIIEGLRKFIENRDFVIHCKENAKKYAKDVYNWQSKSKPLLDLYKELLQ